MRNSFPILTLLVFFLGCAQSLPVTDLIEYKGVNLESVIQEIEGKKVVDEKFVASEGNVGLRESIPEKIKELKKDPNAEIVREYWIKKGSFYYSFYSIFVDERWIIIEAIKWHEKVQF